MILSIFNDIWNKITSFVEDLYNFIMANFDEPFLWIIIVVILLVISYTTISKIANK